MLYIFNTVSEKTFATSKNVPIYIKKDCQKKFETKTFTDNLVQSLLINGSA